MAAVPPLAELDPERCYVGWEMVLATAAEPDAIRDVFIFVEDSCELTIEPDRRPGTRLLPRPAGCQPADPTARALEETAPVPAAAAPTTSPTTPRACVFPPPSSTSLSIWWANWSRCRRG